MLEDGAQGGHDRGDAFPARPQLRVEQALGGVVDDGDEREPLVGEQGQPAMATAVEMEQLAEAGPRLAPPPVAAPGAVFGHQPGALQGLLDEGVAEAHPVLAAGELVEVAHIEPLIAVAVQGQEALDLGHRRPLGRGRLAAAIEQAVIAMVLQQPPQAPNAPGAAAENVGRLDPTQLPGQRSRDHFVDLHGALHGAGRIGHGHLLGDHSFHAARRERSCHGVLPSGQLTYPQHPGAGPLDRPTQLC